MLYPTRIPEFTSRFVSTCCIINIYAQELGWSVLTTRRSMKQRGNNIPSDAAFEKLREWKESGTVLKATLFPNKAPLIVSVFSVLETEFMVGIVAETPPHDHHPLD